MYTGPQPIQPPQAPEPGQGQTHGESDRFEPGHIIEGRYKVVSLLGMGGMGAVYLVEQIFLHKHFALKLLSSDKVNEKNILRFQKEAQAANGLDHPGLTKVHDFGTINQHIPFFVMDYVQGESLSDRILRGGALSVDEALPILIKSALALAHAHDKGIVHRDLKPSNIMLTRDEDGERSVKIVDFGIAKFIYGESDDLQALTRTGEIFGSPFYMSPEQCMGLAVDNRSDIYSFGCLMFETLTGNPPFLGDTALATMLRHQNEKPMTLREAMLGQPFPPALERIVAKLLEKDPNMRYQDLFALATDLEQVRRGTDTEMRETATRVFVREAAEKSKKVDWMPVVLATGIVFTVSAVSFMAGRFTVPVETKKPLSNPFETALPLPRAEDKKVLDERSEKTQELSDATVKVAAKDASAKSTYFSDTRIFRFPTDVSLGNIYAYKPRAEEENTGLPEFYSATGTFLGTGWKLIDTYGTGKLTMDPTGIPARGTLVVKNFQPLALRMSAEAAVLPRLMARFRDDELAELDLQGLDIKNADLMNWTRFKHLKRLNLKGTEINSLAAVNAFPELTDFNAGFGWFKMPELLKLKRLRDFRSLDVSYLGDGNIMVKALKDDTNLVRLNLGRTQLNNQSIDLLLTMPNIERLELYDNPGLSREAVTKLAKLKKLRYIVLPFAINSIEGERWIRQTFPQDRVKVVVPTPMRPSPRRY